MGSVNVVIYSKDVGYEKHILHYQHTYVIITVYLMVFKIMDSRHTNFFLITGRALK